MNEVNKTLFIPLYGKAQTSKKGVILCDPKAEEIWDKEAFQIKGKSKSKWLSYNMSMRARVFDDWTVQMLNKHCNSTVIHIGCGLDSRCLRVDAPRSYWIDCDFPEVIDARKKYYTESPHYTMKCVDATKESDLNSLPDAPCAIVVLEGVSMYLTNQQLKRMLALLSEKYKEVYVLMDVYTEFGAKASRFKNPVNDVGVTTLYGVDNLSLLLEDSRMSVTRELSFTPDYLVGELAGLDRLFFKMMFTGKMYKKIYRLFELETVHS